MKKWITVLILTIIVLSYSSNISVAADQTTSIKIDGLPVSFNDQSGYPFVDGNSRTQVPFRVTLEAFGAEVQWDGQNQIAIAIKNGIQVEVPIGESYIWINHEKKQNDTIALLKDGRTYLPIRAVMEAFGCKVSWNEKERVVVIVGESLTLNEADLIEGNTLGNIQNEGYVAQQGEWLYYRGQNMDGTHSLCKIKIDGTGRTVLSKDEAKNINVVGDWIYYSVADAPYFTSAPMYKIKTDGTGKTIFNDESMGYVNFDGDWVYYTNWSAANSAELYRVRIDGTEKERLSTDKGHSINVVGDWIYYSNTNDKFRIYKMKTDKTEKSLICDDEAENLIVYENFIYYKNNSDGLKIYRINTDGTNKLKIGDDSIYAMNISGDWIYYASVLDKNIYKMKIDGTSKIKLNDDMHSTNINIAGDWIYYSTYSETNSDGLSYVNAIYKMRMNGTDKVIAK